MSIFEDGEMAAVGRTEAPDWVESVAVSDPPRFDARAVIATGRDPRDEIISFSAGISGGKAFAVDAPFNPVPLRMRLARDGFSSFGCQLTPDHWEVFFLLDGKGMDGLTSGEHLDGCTEFDLRGLEPPGPMVEILRRIGGEDPGDGFTVRLERDPVFLYPELDELGWSCEHLDAPEGEVRLRLFKTPGSIRP